MENNIKINDLVRGGKGEDADTGRVVAIEGETATVAWDSHVTTSAPLSILTVIGHRDVE